MGVANVMTYAVAHEMFHSTSKLDHTLCQFLLGPTIYAHYDDYHLNCHHLHVSPYNPACPLHVSTQ